MSPRMWFMIPTPPYVVDGLERGSARNRRFALRSDEEVREYLRREPGESMWGWGERSFQQLKTIGTHENHGKTIGKP